MNFNTSVDNMRPLAEEETREVASSHVVPITEESNSLSNISNTQPADFSTTDIPLTHSELVEEYKRLRTILQYIETHPQHITNIATYYAGPHFEKEVHTKQIDIKPVAYTPNVNTNASTPLPDQEPPSHTKDISICQYIVFEKIRDNTTYGRNPDERLDQYNRLIYRMSQKPFPTFVKFLKTENEKGYLRFNNDTPSMVFEHFMECYGEMHAGNRAFRDACFKERWMPK